MADCVLVTGAAGFIGSHLCEELVRHSSVVGVDNFDPFYARSVKEENLRELRQGRNFTFYEADITDDNLMRQVFLRHRPESVVHLAAKAGVRPSLADPGGYVRTNVEGTTRILELSHAHGAKNFVFGSSSSVYGGSNPVPFREDMTVDSQLSAYAVTKRASELMCKSHSSLYGLRIAALRFFTVYGPRQRPDLAVTKFTHLIDRGERVPLFGDGNSARDYTYVVDAVQGVMKALSWLDDAHEGTFEIFNIGESRVTRLDELVELIEAALAKQAVRQYLPEQPGDMRSTFADVGKAAKLLGYAPSMPIREGIQLYVEYYRGQSNGG